MAARPGNCWSRRVRRFRDKGGWESVPTALELTTQPRLAPCGSLIKGVGTESQPTNIMPVLGGFKITNVGWAGRSSVFVDLDAGDYTDKLFQLYVNRKLVGVTNVPSQRRVIGQVWDAHLSAAPLSVMAVDPIDRMTDFGDVLEEKPWNRYRLTWTVPEGYAVDCHHFDVLKASAPNTDPTEVIAKVQYSGPRDYSLDLPAIPTNHPPRADWRYAVVPRDDATTEGNAGTSTIQTVPALIYPADLLLQADGNRFGLSLDAGVLTASFALAN